tara:strand:- start:221 stop:460 length:240 start_codon:yes stop_codon:yes gene_type:complete
MYTSLLIRPIIRFFVLFLVVNAYNSQTLEIGDTIPHELGLPWCANNSTSQDSLFFHDYNGETNDNGRYSVIWAMYFTSW